MAQGVDVTLLGDKKLDAKLARLPVVLQKKIVRKALRRSAVPFRTDMRATIPTVTGGFRRTVRIKVRSIKRSRARDAGFGVNVTAEQPGVASQTAKGVAAVEMGTRDTRPQPWIRNAFRKNVTGAKVIIAAEIRIGILDEARKP